MEGSRMVSKQHADQIAGGVFFIGLGLLFTDVIDFWPGILFVLGAASLARGMAEGRAWYTVSGGLWLIGLGMVFLFGFSWPLLLILIGASMLVGRNHGWMCWGEDTGEKRKRKNEEIIRDQAQEVV
jgi:hypothetical protein